MKMTDEREMRMVKMILGMEPGSEGEMPTKNRVSQADDFGERGR
jgi:hypothetical protein